MPISKKIIPVTCKSQEISLTEDRCTDVQRLFGRDWFTAVSVTTDPRTDWWGYTTAATTQLHSKDRPNKLLHAVLPVILANTMCRVFSSAIHSYLIQIYFHCMYILLIIANFVIIYIVHVPHWLQSAHDTRIATQNGSAAPVVHSQDCNQVGAIQVIQVDAIQV